MTRIAFSCIDALPAAIECFSPDAVISIETPGHSIEEIKGCEHLILAMHDTEDAFVHRAIAPDTDHIDAIETFLRLKPARLLTHCVAGLSRSPAVAIIAAVRSGRSSMDAARAIFNAVPHAQPNRLLLSLADEAFGVDTLAASMEVFTYDRGRFGPDGERAGFHELSFDGSKA
jgi:predicted protein tyrosine phosphatase